MDDATLQRIVGIVKTMQSSGMEKDAIVENLRSMGVSDDELEGILVESGLQAPKPLEPVPPVAEEHIERLHTNVNELHVKHDEMKGSLSGIDDIKHELQEIKAEINDIKPQLGALKRINENLIDINKKMLARLATK
ncbi:hypothetical protein ACFLQ2_01010 [archaeon]